MIWFSGSSVPTDDPGRDELVEDALRSLDPASYDPNYWFRFHGSVMTRAANELAHRRMMAELTIADVLISWARAVVPTAAFAAAAAAFVLLRAGSGPVDQFVGLDELLVVDLPMETQLILADDAATTFASRELESF